MGLWSLDPQSPKTQGPRPKSYATLTAMRRLLFLLLPAIFLTSCAGSLFKVRPVTELPPLPATSRSADAGGISIRVAPLLTDEESQTLFEANLPLSGVLPVRMELFYQSGVPVEMKRARFLLRDGQGREWKFLTSKQAISRILKANGVFAYNPNARKQFEQDFGAYAFDLKTPLSPSERRQGFIFFQTPDKLPVQTSTQLSLAIDRLPQPATIQLQ